MELATEKGLDVVGAENALIVVAWPTKPGRLSELLLEEVSGVKGRGNESNFGLEREGGSGLIGSKISLPWNRMWWISELLGWSLAS